MISDSNEQLQQELEYTQLKSDFHDWGFSKMQSGRQDTLEELYAIIFWLNLEKNVTKPYGVLETVLGHPEWNKNQFLSGIRDSWKAGSLWGMMRGVGGVRKSIDECWLAKDLGLGLGLLCWGFKGIEEGITREEASTHQIG